jgi:hypothetical protein
MTNEEKKQYCHGCRENYYNQSGNSSCGHCWMLDNSKVVTRYRIGWWTQPTQPGAYTKVTTLNCHNSPGNYALHEEPARCSPDRQKLLSQQTTGERNQ